MSATFVLDLATRERGYGLIKVGIRHVVDAGRQPGAAWPGDEDYKPALGCWVWNPNFGELRLETNADLSARHRQRLGPVQVCPEAIRGLQPSIRFVDRVDVPIKSVGKTFFGPVIQIVGWVERNNVPGWKERTPTVAPPAAPPLLAAASAPAPASLSRSSQPGPRPGEGRSEA